MRMHGHKEPPASERIDAYRVGLVLTEQCNIACRHCWFNCGPGKTARMSLDDALGYIRQAGEISTVQWISISGGEPFLFPEMLKQVIRAAAKADLHTECVTNCFWAKTREVALKTLRELRDAGLEVVNLSADDFHQEHLSFEHVRNCFQACKSLGLKPVIMCTVGRSSGLTLKRMKALLGDEGIRILGEAAAHTGPVTALAVQSVFLPHGRAASLPEDELMVGHSPLGGPCQAVLKDISISPQGAVYPCCSAGGLLKGVEIGNARQGEIRDLIRQAKNNPLFKVLSTEGPEGLARRCRIPLEEKGYVSKCHLCYEVLREMMQRKMEYPSSYFEALQ